MFSGRQEVEASTARERLVGLGSSSPNQRMAHLFCELVVRLEAVGFASGAGYAFPIKQDQLGATIGLSPVHTNRSLQQLRRRGLIELEECTVRIKDRRALRHSQDFAQVTCRAAGEDACIKCTISLGRHCAKVLLMHLGPPAPEDDR